MARKSSLRRIRTNSSSASGVIPFARRVGNALDRVDGDVASRQATQDGFLISAKRLKQYITVDIIDPPALIVLSGQLSHPKNPYFYESPVLQASRGRDTFLFPEAVQDLSIEADDDLLLLAPGSPQIVGTAVSKLISYKGMAGESAHLVNEVGVLRSYATLEADEDYAVNPLAYLPRSAVVRYNSFCMAPNISRVAIGAEGRSSVSSESLASTYCVVILDSFLRARGYLPYCMRVSPPEYDPESTDATTWQRQQAPWHMAVAERFINDSGSEPITTFRITVCIQVVLNMLSDEEPYGERGLWFGTFHITSEGLTLAGEYTLDPRTDPNPLSRPYRTPADGDTEAGAYRFNCYLRTGAAVLRSGAAVFLAPFAADQFSTRYLTVDAIVIDRDGALIGQYSILEAAPMYSAPRTFGAPIGCAVKLVPDDEPDEVIAIFFSAVYVAVNTVLSIVSITEAGATTIFQEDVFFYPCIAGVSHWQLSTGQPDVFHSGWALNGAGGSQVCYIGNNKYLFYTSSVIDGIFYVTANWAAAVFDRTLNTAAVVGVINPEMISSYLSEYPFTVGVPDCVQQEVADEDGNIIRRATIIATRGGWDLGAGVELGETWISYDSGETWAMLANDGSSSGAFYVGNIIQARG